MSEPFLAEIKMVGFNFAPPGWALCDGRILPINQNQSLYSLLGTTYGGDGETSFALPELRGRFPVHEGNGFSLGQRGGEETHAISFAEMPSHSHSFSEGAGVASNDTADSPGSGGTKVPARSIPNFPAWSNTATGTMAAGSVSNVGAGQAHENMQPYLAINFCIALQGLFPSR